MSSIIQIQSSLNVLAREVLNIITSIDSEESSYSDVTDDGNSEKRIKIKMTLTMMMMKKALVQVLAVRLTVH